VPNIDSRCDLPTTVRLFLSEAGGLQKKIVREETRPLPHGCAQTPQGQAV